MLGEKTRAILVVLLAVRQRMRDTGSQVGVQSLERRRDRGRRAVGAGCLMSLPLPLEQVAAQKQSRQIRWIDRQRALKCAFFTGLVAQVLAGEGEIDPLLGVGTIGGDEAREGRAAGRHVSLEKRALSERRQGWRMARINLKDSPPEPVSFFVP